MKRIINNQLSTTLQHLRLHNASSKQYHHHEAITLLKAAVAISRKKEENLTQAAFETIKKTFTKAFIQELKPLIGKEYSAHQNIPCHLLEKLFNRQLRSTLQHLQHQTQVVKVKVATIGQLEHTLRRKEHAQLREALNTMTQLHHRKKNATSAAFKIINQFYAHQLVFSFSKLMAYGPSSPVHAPRSRVPSKRPTQTFQKQ